MSLVRSQCYVKSDSALLEGAELVNRIPQSDLNSFMTSKVTSFSDKMLQSAEDDLIISAVLTGSINRLDSYTLQMYIILVLQFLTFTWFGKLK